MILVGGFAASPYLQQAVQAAAVRSGLALSVVVPPLPHAAVMIGGWQQKNASPTTGMHRLCHSLRRGLHLWPQP